MEGVRRRFTRLRSWLWRPERLWLLVLVAFAVAAPVLYFVPKWLTPDSVIDPRDRAALDNDARVMLLQAIGGLLLALTIFFTWRRVTIAEQGQITERFTRAIEQLGSDKLEVRLGGIYALERIARDSVRDHWPIMEVLTAFVRENARWGRPCARPSRRPRERPPPADIQAILTVLGRRERSAAREGDGRLDLTATNLRRASLAGAHLERAILHGAHLEGANLREAHLREANLYGAHLAEAHFGGAHLEGADLSGGANLAGATLSGAHLEGAHLEWANLAGATLSEAHLEGADLSGATGLTQAQIDKAFTDEDTKLPQA